MIRLATSPRTHDTTRHVAATPSLTRAIPQAKPPRTFKMHARAAVLVALALGHASATNCTSYPCTCEDNLDKPPRIRDDGVCVKVGKVCNAPKDDCGGVRPNLNEAQCAAVASQPYYAAQCNEETGEVCWTWCPVPPPTAVRPVWKSNRELCYE